MSSPKLYTKKPVTIQAYQLNRNTFQDIIKWVGLDNLAGFDLDELSIRIKTLEGVMEASENDFIICGVKGEFYPCKPDIFNLSYSEVSFS